MASKIYTVTKDGEVLKELKTLTAAKKLADTDGAEVLCDGECVYQGTAKGSEDTVPVLSSPESRDEAPVVETVTPEEYTLTIAVKTICLLPDWICRGIPCSVTWIARTAI